MQSTLLALSLLCAFSTTVILACSPEGEMGKPTDILGKVYYSHAVVIGRVLMRYPTMMISPESYTAALQVDCVVKDNKHIVTLPNFNVTEAGFIEGMCHSAHFDMAKKYIVFLRLSNDMYKPWESPELATESSLRMVMKACDINPRGDRCRAPAQTCTPDTEGYSDGQADNHDGHDHDDHEDDRYDHEHDEHDDHIEGAHDHDDHHDDDDDAADKDAHPECHDEHNDHDHDDPDHEHVECGDDVHGAKPGDISSPNDPEKAVGQGQRVTAFVVSTLVAVIIAVCIQ